jgi:DNA-binding transcriptional regulator GbsR (MarR family)
METSLSPYGYTKDGKVYLKGYLSYPDREIGEVRNSDAESIQYFVNRFSIAENKVATLAEQVEEVQNKGSFLTKLIQLRKVLIEFDGLGDFIPLLSKLDELELNLRDMILTNQIKNLEIKKALIDEAIVAVNVESEEGWQIATENLLEIKTKWLKTGPVDKSLQEQIEGEFTTINDDFFQRRREFYTEKNRLIDERLERLRVMVDESQNLVYSADVDNAYTQIKLLQNEWKTIGAVPVKKGSKLWKKFRRNNDKFFERYNNVKGIVVKPRVDPNLLALQNMALEAEQLVNDQAHMARSAERAKELLVKWKNTISKVKNFDRNLPEKFRLMCDKIFEMNYLFRVISYRHPNLFEKPRVDQLKIMINQMDYMAKKEKVELESFEDTISMAYPKGDVPKEDQSKINVQRRKISVKEMLLIEFKKELENQLVG